MIPLWVYGAGALSARALTLPPSFLHSLTLPRQDERKPNAREAAQLEPGLPVTHNLAGGERHIYRLTLTAGQYAQVRVEQKGIDVVARVSGADGRVIADIDAERRSQGAERVELVAEADGHYEIEIAPSAPRAGTGAYVIQLFEVRTATAPEKLLHEARRQYYEAQRLNDAGYYEEALAPANRALEIREKVLGPSHGEVAASLRSLGMLYWDKTDIARAEIFLQRAAEVTAKTSGTETLDYADVLHGLARLRFFKGDYAQAEEMNRRALSIREKEAGPDGLLAAASLFNLALLSRATSDLPRAEDLYLRVLSIRERWLGPDHVEVSDLLNNLGLLYYGVGDYSSAERLLGRSLAIREKAFGPDRPQVGQVLNNLGLVAWKKGDYAKAEAYYQRALTIHEKTTGPESRGVASNLHNLGIIYKEASHDYAKAEEYYRRSLAIYEKLYGEFHEGTGNAVESLGILYQAMGDYDGAEQFYLRALAIYERAFGPNNTGTLRALSHLVRTSAIKGDIARSIEYQRRLSASEEKLTPLNAAIGSERQKIAYFKQLQRPDRVISLHVRLAPDEGTARDLAATTVLERKGRVLDALSANLLTLRRQLNAGDQALLDRLDNLNSQLARLALSGPQRTSPEEHQSQITGLEEEREKLEAEISRRSAGFYGSSRPVSLADVRSAIPGDAALIEFAVYRPFDWKATDDKTAYGEPRYVAYVMRQQGEVAWRELGAVKEIDAALETFRQSLRDPRRQDVPQHARAVDEKVMQPLRALLGDASHLLISPDGTLNLLPFEALIDEQGQYLVRRYSFTYLTSGRDLLRLQVARGGGSRPTVVANPSFGEPATEQIASAAARPIVSRSRRRSVTTARDLSGTYFSPLGNTALEAQTIHRFFPEANLLTGARATESALKGVAAPRLLHIATHGFFLQEVGKAPTSAIEASARIDNPLLRSGLALAGANARGFGGGDDDGILTALEATGLNLWGTKLVVLSACDTGVGEVRNGEGVYGLRRAFLLAGAESLLMSLWPASDYMTRELMTSYYKNLKAGLGRGEALRRVQLEMLGRRPQLHPFYWANFIQLGEWANLDGRR